MCVKMYCRCRYINACLRHTLNCLWVFWKVQHFLVVVVVVVVTAAVCSYNKVTFRFLRSRSQSFTSIACSCLHIICICTQLCVHTYVRVCLCVCLVCAMIGSISAWVYWHRFVVELTFNALKTTHIIMYVCVCTHMYMPTNKYA